MINKEELFYYNYINPFLKIVFDVGCRIDIDYIKLSSGKDFHLFEPNPVFFMKLVRTLKVFEKTSRNNIYANPFGLSNKNGEFDYYIDAQSFIPRQLYFNSNLSEKRTCFLRSFMDYVNEKEIKHIDFLKMDTEGGEPEILFDNDSINFLKQDVDYIQFEYASTWFDRQDDSNLLKVFDIYRNEFAFYFLRNETHPISQFCPSLLSGITDISHVVLVDEYAKAGYGFEIELVRKTTEFANGIKA